MLKGVGRKKLEVQYLDAEKDSDDVQDFAGKWSMCTGDEGEPCTVGVDTVFTKVNLVNNIMGEDQWDELEAKLNEAWERTEME